MAYPSGLTTLLRFDGTQVAYTDLAQAVPAVAPDGLVRSVPQPAPLSGSWTAPSDYERPSFSAAGTVACEPLALDYPAHNGQYLNAPAPASPVSGNSATLAVSFRAFKLFNGPQAALLTNGLFGLYLGGNGLALRYNGGALWDSLIKLGKDLNSSLVSGDSGEGNLICIVARWTPTGLNVYVDEEGAVSTASLTATINASTPTDFLLGYAGGGYGNALFGQAAVIDGAVSDAKRDELIAFMQASSVAQAFPTTQPFVSVIGDSIGVPFGVASPQGWAYRMLANLRATYPTLRMINPSISGSGISTLSGNFSAQATTTLARLSGARAKQAVILQQGTNEIVGNPSDAGVDAGIAKQFALADAMRSAGAKVLIATVIDRTGLLGSTTQSQFNAARVRWNAAIVASGLTHCDGLVRLDLVAGMGANGDSTSATNFAGDGVHPAGPGHVLLEPAYTAAVLNVFAPPAPPAPIQGLHRVTTGGRGLLTASGKLIQFTR